MIIANKITRRTTTKIKETIMEVTIKKTTEEDIMISIIAVVEIITQAIIRIDKSLTIKQIITEVVATIATMMMIIIKVENIIKIEMTITIIKVIRAIIIVKNIAVISSTTTNRTTRENKETMEINILEVTISKDISRITKEMKISKIQIPMVLNSRASHNSIRVEILMRKITEKLLTHLSNQIVHNQNKPKVLI